MTTKEERQHGFTFSDAGRALHDGRITTNDTKHVARQITESLFAHPNAEQITNAERKINEHRTRIAQEHRNGPDWIGSLNDPTSWASFLERERQHRENRRSSATKADGS